MKHYWGSNTLTGDIRRLNADTFEELSRNYFESGVPSAYTRDEYLRLNDEDKKRVKNGAYVTACSFKEGTTRRANENAEDIQLVILDIDNSDEANYLLSISENIKDQMRDINFLIHTTVSHTKEKPRLRVLVSAGGCELSTRSRLTLLVANMLGLTTPTNDKDGNPALITHGYDSCSTVTSQPFFRPVTFKDDTIGGIIASRTNGRDIAESDLPEEEEDLLDTLEENFAYDGDPQFDDDDLENRQIVGLEIDWVQQALTHIDPDEADSTGNTYLPWFKICCALRHQYRDEEEAAEAFEIFDTWSARGSKYTSREATYRKWKSFVPCPKGRRPSTIRSLFKRAIQAGWDYSTMAAKVQQTFEEWLFETDSPVILASEGVARIAAMPFKDENEIIQNDLLAKLQQKLKKLGIAGVTTPELKKQLRKEKVKAAPKEDKDDRPQWLQPWCYLSSNNTYFNTINKTEMIPAAFNAVYGRELMHLIPEGQPNVNGKPPVLPTDYAQNVKEIPNAYGVTYDPSYGGDHTFVKLEGHTYVNRYQPPDVKPQKKHAKEAEAMIREFLAWAIREEFVETYIIDMIAFAIQNPDKKVRIATLFQGVEGVGKSLFGNMLAHLFGQHNTKHVSPLELDSAFNSYAKDGHLVLMEELHAAGQNRKRIMDVLKEMVTNDIITVTEKYKNPTKVVNKMLVFGFTNHLDAISITANDRRFFCVRMKPTKQEQMAKIKEGFYTQLARLSTLSTGTEEKGHHSLVQGMVYFFNNFKVSKGFDPNARAPETEFRQQLVETSLNPVQAEIEDLVQDEEYPLVGEDVICIAALKEAMLGATDASKVSHFLTHMGYTLYTHNATRRFSINGRRTSIWYNLNTFDPLFGTPDTILRERIGGGDADKLSDLE